MNLEGFDELVNKGRNLINDDYASHVHRARRAFNAWVEEVVLWIQNLLPNTSFAAEWSSLGRSCLKIADNSNYDPLAWVNFCSVMDKRLKWHSQLALAANSVAQNNLQRASTFTISKKVFIVHGRNTEIKETVSRFLEKLGLEPIILHEQPNAGKTIIEKFLEYADVSFAIILMTPDDTGGLIGESFENQKPRARQNVILELGFFLGRIGRERTCIIFDQSVEVSSDYDGVLYVPFDNEGAWQLKLAKEMKNAQLPFDMNALLQ